MATQPNRAAWLKGGEILCNVKPDTRKECRRFVLLGAPGVGKGTQAELLARHFGACPLSTGDIFRSAKNSKDCDRSSTMRVALGFMQAGELVPDEIVLMLVKERLRCLRCDGGFLLDGFPRTVAQASVLEEIFLKNQIELDAVLSYELPVEQIVARISGRRTCSNCKRVFHLESRPPMQSGFCDGCGEALVQREDDRPQAVLVRLSAYERSTTPLVEFYRQRNLLIQIDAAGTPQDAFERTLKLLGARDGEKPQ